MTTLRLISSMATKALLADLVALYKTQAPNVDVQVESVGGVDAAKRVEAGEAFDGVVLASNAIDKLMAGERGDLLFTDPPWNVNYGAVKAGNAQGYKPRKILNDHMDGADWAQFVAGFCASFYAVTKPGALAYVVWREVRALRSPTPAATSHTGHPPQALAALTLD